VGGLGSISRDSSDVDEQQRGWATAARELELLAAQDRMRGRVAPVMTLARAKPSPRATGAVVVPVRGLLGAPVVVTEDEQLTRAA
jgi:hypothetical protein